MTAYEVSMKFLAILSAIILIAGIFYSLNLGNELRFHDEQVYYKLATNLVSHHLFSMDGQHSSLFRPPGYSLFLAPFVFLGCNVIVLRILNFVALVICVILIYCILKKLVSPRAGLIGAFLVASYPVLFYTAGTLYPQILAACIFLLVLYLLIVKTAWKWSFLLSGLLFGWLVLTVPTFLYTLGLLLVWAWATGGFRLLKKYLITALIACLVISLWTVRNYTIVHHLVPVSANSGYMLLLGNCEKTTPNAGPNTDISQYLSEAKRLELNEYQEEVYYKSKAFEWIRNHKAAALKLYLLKTLNHFNYRNDLYTKSEESAAKEYLMLFTFGPLLLLFLGRILCAKIMKLSNLEILLIGLYITSAFVHAVFFTRIRYRLPFDFLLIIVVASFLNEIFNRWKIKRDRFSAGA
jgi:hypothetical protein